MPLTRPYVVQIEYMPPLAGGMNGLAREVRERANDGFRLKTVVRFYDLDGSFTAYLSTIARLSKAHERAGTACHAAKGLVRSFHSWRSGRFLKKEGLCKARALKKSKELLARALRSGEGVAVELDPSRPFRFVRRDEAHELLEAAKRAEGAWYFVFPFRELCDDSPGKTLVSVF